MSTGSGKSTCIISHTAHQSKLHRCKHAVAEMTPTYSARAIDGSFPWPWHSSHFPEPSQTPQATVRRDLNQRFRTSRSPLPSHLLQRPVPLQKGQALGSPSKVVPHVPRLYYAPAEGLATQWSR
jgi:hypothetical protein